MLSWIRSRIKSIHCALTGLSDILRHQHNARIHAGITLLVLTVSWWVKLSPTEWALVVLSIATVWMTEALNTVLEVLTDMVAPQYSASAKRAKDIAASAVLIASMGALAIGILVLGPALCHRLTM